MDVFLIITILGCVSPLLCEVFTTTTVSTTTGPIKCPTDIPNGTIAAGCSRTVSSYCTYWCDYWWCSKRFPELFCNQYGSWSAGDKACICDDTTRTSTTTPYAARLSTATPYPTRRSTTTTYPIWRTTTTANPKWRSTTTAYPTSRTTTTAYPKWPSTTTAYPIWRSTTTAYPTRRSTTTAYPMWRSTTTAYPTRRSTTNRHFTTDMSWTTSGQVSVRLADSEGPWIGRVEVYYYGVWGTVCDDSFGVDDAYVICKMLGYGIHRYPMVYGNAHFGEGNGTIILDELQCTGSESSIEYCDASWFLHDCSHREDVGIDCLESAYPYLTTGQYSTTTRPYTTKSYTTYTGFTTSLPLSTLGHVSVRLVDSTGPWKGRVEVYYRGVWGTVCDDRFGVDDAYVICKMLGYDIYRYPMVYDRAHFGEGNGTIILDELQCAGSESSIENCDASWFFHDCSHTEDVGIDCLESAYSYLTTGQYSTTTTRPLSTRPYTTYTGFTTSLPLSTSGRVSVRLVNSTDPWKGRVEVYYYGVWGTVCDDRFGVDDAFVVCIMLGYAIYRYPMVYKNAHFGRGSGNIIIDELQCSGSESSIENCDARWFRHDCSHSEDVGIDCYESAYPYLTIRQYSTTATRPYTTMSYTNYTEISPGTTTTHRPTSAVPPNSLTTAITYTTTQKYVSVRLVNGTSLSNGRVEVYYRGEWGTVCDDWFDADDAFVICKMLGLAKFRYPVVHIKAYYGEGRGRIIIDDLSCSGSEDTIEDCASRPWLSHNCRHNEDAGLDCHSYEYLSTTLSPHLSGWYTSTTSRSERTTKSALCPRVIPNGDMSRYCSRRQYSNCRVYCDYGCQSTTTYLTCSSSGTWDGGQTACDCSVPSTTPVTPVRCPASILGGTIDPFCSRYPYSVCKYSCSFNCSPFYANLQCASNGTWLNGERPCRCQVPVEPVECPKEIDNFQVEASCSRKAWAKCTYKCAANCYKNLDVEWLFCRNGTWTWYSTRKPGSLCKCEHFAQTSETMNLDAMIVVIAISVPIGLILFCTIVCAVVKRRKRSRMASSRSMTLTASTRQSPVYTGARAAAPRTAGRTAATQSAGVQNGVASPIYMLSNTVTYQSVQYTASQNSCYLVPEATSSNASVYPVAPPSYSSIAAAKPEVFPPPPSYEEAVSHPTSPRSYPGNNQ